MNFNRGFHLGQRLRWCKQDFIVEKRVDGQHIELKNIAHATTVSVTELELVEAFFAGAVEVMDQPNVCDTDKKFAVRILAVNFADLPPHVRAKAMWRHGYVRATLKCAVNTTTPEVLLPIIAEVAARIQDPTPPSPISVYRWVSKYLKSGGNIRSLADNVTGMGNRKEKIHQDVKSIIDVVIREVFLNPLQQPVAEVCREVVTRICRENNRREKLFALDPTIERLEPLRQPASTTIYDRIRQLDPFERDSARIGERLAKLRYQAYNKGPRPERPLQRAEIDHAILPLFVVDTDRWLPIGWPVFTLSRDKLTDAPHGFSVSFEAEGYNAVAKCLRNAIAPKGYVSKHYPRIKNPWNVFGVPEVTFCDNGPAFWSTALEEASLQLGSEIQYAPPRTPWWKAGVERHFGTIKSELIRRQPGAEFSKMMQVAEYNPAKDACISLDGLLEILHVWLIDIYMQRPIGKRDTTPAAAWDAATTTFPPTLPRNPRELDIFLFRYERRWLRPHGIAFKGLTYNSPELMEVRRVLQRLPNRPKAKVKIDPDNLACVFVLNPETLNYVPAKATDQAYANGLSLWQHRVIRRYALQNGHDVTDTNALSQARTYIQEIVQGEWETGKVVRSRKASSRWLGKANPTLELTDADSRSALPARPLTNGSSAHELDANEGVWAGISQIGNALPDACHSQAVSTDTVEPPNSETNNPRPPNRIDPAATKRAVPSSSENGLNKAPDGPLDCDDWKVTSI